MNSLNAIAIAIAITTGLTACDTSEIPSHEQSMSELYPGPWRDEFNIPISRTFVQNDVTGCGQYKYRASSESPAEYLVHCSRDGKKWTAYIVWSRIEELMGPYDPKIK